MHAYKKNVILPDLKIRSVGPLGVYIYIYMLFLFKIASNPQLLFFKKSGYAVERKSLRMASPWLTGACIAGTAHGS